MKFCPYPSTIRILALSSHTLEYWSYTSKLRNSDLIPPNTGVWPFFQIIIDCLILPNIGILSVAKRFWLLSFIKVANNIIMIKQRPSTELLQKTCFTSLILCYISHTIVHYTIPSLKEGISWFTVTSSKKTKGSQSKLLTKTLESLSYWKNEQFPCSVLAFSSNFGFTVFISFLYFLGLSFKWSNICGRPLI